MATKHRESGVELLKLAAIFIIVISHIAQSLDNDMSVAGIPNDYLINLHLSTTDVNILVLAFFREFGSFGNLIFLVCSAWFLSDSKKAKSEKIISLVADIWIVSVLILVGFLLSGVPVSNIHILHSLLPTTFSNNWYMTTYLLFYAVHGYLNLIMNQISQRAFLNMTIVLGVLYCAFGSIDCNLFCGTNLTLFITVYFIVCYLKKYGGSFMESKKTNLILLFFSIAANLCLVITTNYTGLYFNAYSEPLLHWNRINNPLIIITAVSLLNLARMHQFVNPVINYISKLSFLIYIIHENRLVADYLRTYIWHELYNRYGHNLIILQVLVFSVVLLFISVLLAAFYQFILMKPIHTGVNAITGKCTKYYKKFVDWLLVSSNL